MNKLSKSRIARFWIPERDTSRVRCALCPRGCRMAVGDRGFCGVRGNIKGEMHTFNYGFSVQATVEMIETEAVYHYRPGARILSLGNIGCMLSCSFCQNWETSQVDHLNSKNIYEYTPQQIVNIALAHGIQILSWTYNDPVVWQEFVVDTARLAAQHGIKNLYKSAFFIEKAPVIELCDVMDIFSISLKSMSPEYYVKNTKGQLEPILEAIQIVYESGRHLEISNLLVTDLNDTEEDNRKVARWVAMALGPGVPLHFVRFHPSYKYNEVCRTPIPKLLRAREIAQEEGILHCYLGNLYEPGVSDTRCSFCGQVLVERFGLTVRIVGIDAQSHCVRCGERVPIKEPFGEKKFVSKTTSASKARNERIFFWNQEVNGLHIVGPDDLKEPIQIFITHKPTEETATIHLGHGLSRALVTKSKPEETAVVVQWDTLDDLRFLNLLDRAHYPV